jgi:EAL domain-containing protein (putative c-di-GMP-specific phosphodiesterase class I)/FixJ family two-component response regulator
MNRRILIIDDDPFMLKLLARMLDSFGFTSVKLCESGASGLQEISESGASTDLIVLDINMPEMDGIEIIRRLAGLHYKGGIVLLSGENNRILESAQRLIGAHGLCALGTLPKPLSRDALSNVLRQLGVRSAARGAEAQIPAIDIEDLASAVANGELLQYYQPKVSLQSSELVGAECLVRWQRADGRMVPPDRFISLAEQHGLMRDITREMLAIAMAEARRWQRAGRHLSLAVNVSMNDLTALDFPDIAGAAAHAAGIDPSSITLEVTESQVMKQLGTVLDVLTRLRLKRFRLSIDDFGTGHSSLAQLRDLPFDELKIDRGFVHGAATNETLRAICTASLRMAQQLNLLVVAEGIEDRQDWALLRDLGCDQAQGYLVARPMPAREFYEWARKWTPQQGAARHLAPEPAS